MGSFWVRKHILFELKKYRGVIFHGIKGWCKIWRKTDLWFEKWHEEFGKLSPEHYMSLKFTEGYFMTMKNDAKFEEKLTGHSKTDMRNLKNFDSNTQKSKKIALKLPLFTKVYNFWAKKSTEVLCLIALKIDAKIEGKLTCAFKNDMRNLANLAHLIKLFTHV